jgi:uncharacterized protein YbjT (DUF2867 family)
MIGSLRARILKLEAARPSPVRRFIIVAGLEAEVDRMAVAILPGEVTVILTGVPHAELRPPTIWELAPDGRWLLAEQAHGPASTTEAA